MDTDLRGQRFLVTGASGGIGGAIAEALAGEGADLVLHHHTNRAAVESLAESLAESLGVSALVAGADLRAERDVDRLFAEATSEAGRIDGVVVNAGIWVERPVPVVDMTLAQWEQTMATDLTSAFLTCRGFLRHLRDDPREAASIVLIGSTAGLFGEARHADYAAAKAGLVHGLTASLKNEIVELAPRGRVNCVCPGWVRTPMAQAALCDPRAVAHATATVTMNKIAEPADVAHAVVYLCSAALSGHVTGSILPVDGGMEGRLLRAP